MILFSKQFSGRLIGCKRVSTDTEYCLLHYIVRPGVQESKSWEVNTFVAVKVNKKIYLGLITDIDLNEEEADLSLLFPPLPSSIFTFSEEVPSYVASLAELICPVTVNEKGNNFHLSVGQILKIKQAAKFL